MLNAQPTQLKLNEAGQITYQANASNPLPGVPVAVLKKGASILQPAIETLESDPVKGLDGAAVQTFLQTWLQGHIAAILEPLVALSKEEDAPPAVKGIAFQVYEAMGIIPREQVEDLIALLDQETRRVLRAKKIRLGPVLVFQPDLNKPAAVRLRALLWSLYNGKALPASAPPDGSVSFKIDPATADRSFYQAVGYPVYGPRAIRIDMLDRVISAVYENAKEGKFQARHEMAEWLGCQIEDLYAILEAMGHHKISDPAPKPEAEKTEEKPAEEGEKPPAQAKPELATFRLKKGKAFTKAPPEREFTKPKFEGKKPEKKKFDKKFDKKKEENRSAKIMSTGPARKLEDSPFAILQQLKVKKDGS